MNLSELFIRRPVMTVLLNAAIVLAGVIGYRSIPISALPSYDTPVINVTATLPAGAAVPDYPWSVHHQLHQHSGQHLADTGVRRRPCHRRRSTGRAGGPAARAAHAANGHDPVAGLPQGQPGGRAGAAAGHDLAIDAAVRSAGLCRASDLADSLHHRRCGAGQHLRPQALRGARARAARSAGRTQHQPG